MAQLQSQLLASRGPPLHTGLGQAFVSLYLVGDTFSLHDTLGRCCDIVKMKEDAAAGLSNNKLYVVPSLSLSLSLSLPLSFPL